MLDRLQGLSTDDQARLLPALAHRALWDGTALRVDWRQPFDFLVDAAMPFGGRATDVDADALVARWAELAGERPAEALSEAMDDGGGSRKGRWDRLRMLGPANVLTVTDAIAELGMGKEEDKDWLEAKGLIHHPRRPGRGSGRAIVGELLEALKTAREDPRSRRLAPTKLPLPKTDRF